MFCGSILFISWGLFSLVDNQIIVINDSWKNRIGLGLLLFIQLCGGVIGIMSDYFKKYWLYNEQTGKIDSI